MEVLRMGEWIKVDPKETTNLELVDKLSSILIDPDSFVSESEKNEWYEAIGEAIRRLNKMTDAIESVYKCAEDGTLTIRESAFKKVCSALNKKVKRSKK